MAGLRDAVDRAAAETAPHIPLRMTAPTGWEPGVRYDPNTSLPTEVTTEQVASDTQIDKSGWADLIKHLLPMVPAGHEVRLVEARYDPVAWTRTEAYTRLEGIAAPGKTPAVTKPAWRYRFRIVESARSVASGATDLPHLLKVAKANRRNANPLLGTGRTRVVVISDAQIGKVDHRGGTPELLGRIETLLGLLDAECKRVQCDDAVVADPGDLTEGFENVASQQHLNDLSFPDQLDTANVILTEMVTSVARHHGSTRVATVGSNHGAWRRGKDRLGRPGDDFGILTHKTVARALAYRDDISFVIPDVWQASLSLKVRGAIYGLTHGDGVSNPNGFPDWWAKQTHGGGPLAAATIVQSGHFHHLRIQPSGAIDGRARWWMQAPTIDNGSSWWANGGGGSDCEPGILTYTIDDAGRWDNLRLITA